MQERKEKMEKSQILKQDKEELDLQLTLFGGLWKTEAEMNENKKTIDEYTWQYCPDNTDMIQKTCFGNSFKK